MLIVAIDPGKTSGLAAIAPSAGDTTWSNVTYQYTDVDELLSQIGYYNPDTVVVEQFKLRKSTAQKLSGDRMYSSEVIGAIQTFCAKREIPIVFQNPPVKDTISDNLLANAGLLNSVQRKPHAKDAAKHLLAYMMRKYPDLAYDVLKRDK